MNPGLIKSYIAESSVLPYRIIAHGTADGQVIQAASATALVTGVSGQLGADASERVDVTLSGRAEVELGGVVSRGEPLVANASGMAITAAPTAGNNVRIVGFATVSGVSGDIIPFDIALGLMQG